MGSALSSVTSYLRQNPGHQAGTAGLERTCHAADRRRHGLSAPHDKPERRRTGKPMINFWYVVWCNPLSLQMQLTEAIFIL